MQELSFFSDGDATALLNWPYISSAVSTVLRAEVCARAMGDSRSIVDTAIWTKPTESLWVLNGFAGMPRLDNAGLREAPEGQGVA